MDRIPDIHTGRVDGAILVVKVEDLSDAGVSGDP